MKKHTNLVLLGLVVMLIVSIFLNITNVPTTPIKATDTDPENGNSYIPIPTIPTTEEEIVTMTRGNFGLWTEPIYDGWSSYDQTYACYTFLWDEHSVDCRTTCNSTGYYYLLISIDEQWLDFNCETLEFKDME